ncbi:MAG: hypothetical protein NTY53_02805 [Kiritimatiellaeota bacterium]|nr:hypothetical protein [Kiritimatiellota bacterium]
MVLLGPLPPKVNGDYACDKKETTPNPVKNPHARFMDCMNFMDSMDVENLRATFSKARKSLANFFQGLERGGLIFSNGWKKGGFGFPILGKVAPGRRPGLQNH